MLNVLRFQACFEVLGVTYATEGKVFEDGVSRVFYSLHKNTNHNVPIPLLPSVVSNRS